MRSSSGSCRWSPTSSGRCCRRQLPAIPTAGAGGVLPDVAVGRRRLLRLLPAAGRPMGHLDRGRQRSRHSGGGDDGDHAQPGPRPPRASRAAGLAAGARRPAVVPALYRGQRGLRHGVLRGLRPRDADADLRAAPATIRRCCGGAARRSSRRSTRSAARRWGSSTTSPTTRRPWRSSPTTRWRSTPTASPRPWTPAAPSSA